MPTRLDPTLALLSAPAIMGLALAAACVPDPLAPALGPRGPCGRDVDTLACDGGWAFDCAPDPATGRCAWRMHGAPCRGEPEARGPLVASMACGR